MKKAILLVGLGGFAGSICRYLISVYISKYIPSSFPYGTFIANILGCFIIGLIFGLGIKQSTLSPEWRIFLATGFCGGFTTFSTFAYENVKLLQDGYFSTFLIYSFATFLSGILAVYFGMMLNR